MSIKYSEIYTAGSVLTAGANDKMVIAVVNGLAPTGYTSKGILVSDFLLGAQQDWQSVMDNGSSALDIVSDAILTTDEFKIDFKSKKDEDKEARLILDYFVKTEISYRDYISGTNLIKIDAAGIEIQDQLSLKGAFYSDDYEANFVARSLVTKQYVDGLNGIYSGSGILSGVTNVGINGNQLEFEGTFSKKTLIDIDGNLILEGSDIKFQVGRYSVDNTLPNGGVEITNGLGGGSRWGTIRGKGGTAFLTDQTTFLLYSDVDRASIFDFNHLNVLAGRFHSRVSGVIYSGGDLDISANLKIADGSQGNIGDVWTSTDALGNGGWAAGGGGANGIYGGSDTIVAGVETLVSIPNLSKLNFGSGDLVLTGANLPGVGQGRNVGIKVGALNPLAPLQIGIAFNGTGQAPMVSPLTGHTAIFQNNFNVSDASRFAIVSGVNGFGSLDFGDALDIDVGRVFYRHNTNQMSFYTNAVEQVLISSAGEVTVNDLSGTGSRMVVSDAAGLLSTQAIPTSGVSDNLYTANGTLLSARTVTMAGFGLTFSGNQTTFKGLNDLSATSSLVAQNSSAQKTLQVKNDGQVIIGKDIGGVHHGWTTIKALDLTKPSLSIGDTLGNKHYTMSRGTMDIHGGQNFTEIKMGTWNASSSLVQLRAVYDGQHSLRLEDGTSHQHLFYISGTKAGTVHLNSSNKTLATVKIGGAVTSNAGNPEVFDVRGNANENYLNVLRSNGNVGIGILTPTAKLHVKGGDVLVEGATDLNLLNIERATNQFAIGSVPFAGVKASIVNTEAQQYSFLVLNQATTSEFSVRETGEVRIGAGQLNVGSALIGTEKAIFGGQTIVNAIGGVDQFYFTGDGGISKAFSMGNAVARGNHFYMEDSSGVEFALIGQNGDSFLNPTQNGATFILGASATVGAGAKFQVDVKISDGAIPSALFSNDNNNLVVLNTTNDNSGFGTETPDASAVVDFTSTKGGILIPRMTGAQATLIGAPADGLMLYITVIDATFSFVGFWKRDAGVWVQF